MLLINNLRVFYSQNRFPLLQNTRSRATDDFKAGSAPASARGNLCRRLRRS
jgi:hypothetical protein